MTPLPSWPRRALTSAVFLLVGTLLFLAAMERGLNHDEHQFLAPGVLLSREGLLPYRDYPMFHLPNLTFVYAGLERLTHQPIFSAKLLNVIASTLSITLIYWVGTEARPDEKPRSSQFWMAAAIIILLLTDQLFTFTSGKTWNHELPAMLLVVAILAHVRGISKGSWAWQAISGLGVGMAIGTRLTFLPVALAFPLLIAFAPLTRRTRVLSLIAWGGACLVSLAPSIYLFCAEREPFLFDNLRFPRLRLEDVTDTRAQKTMTWWRKGRFFVKEILCHSLPLATAALAALAQPLWRWFKSRRVKNYGLLVCGCVLPLAIIGCALPSRYQYQHYFVVSILLALAAAFSLQSIRVDASRLVSVLFLSTVVVSFTPLNEYATKKSGGLLAYRGTLAMLDYDNWLSNRLRKEFLFVKAIPGPILTLSPSGVLEAGGRIVPEFATGPFAWRGAPLIERASAGKFGFVRPDMLEQFVPDHRIAGILTGVEDESLEKPFITYAEAHDWTPVKVSKRMTFWSATLYRPSLPQ